MSDRHHPACRCPVCVRNIEERAMETDTSWQWMFVQPKKKEKPKEPPPGYLERPGDEYSTGRIIQIQKPDGSITYRFVRTTFNEWIPNTDNP